MIRRKYLKSGDKNPHAKIEADLNEIERRNAAGEKVKDLAAELGVHPSTLYRKLSEFRDKRTEVRDDSQGPAIQ